MDSKRAIIYVSSFKFLLQSRLNLHKYSKTMLPIHTKSNNCGGGGQYWSQQITFSDKKKLPIVYSVCLEPGDLLFLGRCLSELF